MEEAGIGNNGLSHKKCDKSQKKRKYRRHTPDQIKQLEALFKECPNPVEKQRLKISRDLGLDPCQVKFWFQNRRTQLKNQHERSDNYMLKLENEKMKRENEAIQGALKSVLCATCGGPPSGEDRSLSEQFLRMENSQMREEVQRLSITIKKHTGRPASDFLSLPLVMDSALDVITKGLGGPAMDGRTIDLDLLSGDASTPRMPCLTMDIPELKRKLMSKLATNAMDELIRLVQAGELWMKSTTGRDVLIFEEYERSFSRAKYLKNSDIEASKDSGIVTMNGSALINMFMDSDKWVELFPTIVSKARTTEEISAGETGSQSGTLKLMYEELQVLSPLGPTRELHFLRYCQQIKHGLWVMVDVSNDISRNNDFSLPTQSCRRLPSGCLIQDLQNGCSKVTWVEFVEVDDKTQTHQLYRDLVHSGLAFGAERWVAALQRMCQRLSLMGTGVPTQDLGGVISSPEGTRSIMKLSQRMISYFCASLNTTNGHQWSTASGLNTVGVRINVRRSTEPGEPKGMILSAATSIWLPVAPHIVFNFFTDGRARAQWDVLFNRNSVQEIAHIMNGSNSGNRISIFQAFNPELNNMLILQESCVDSSGSLVIYAPLDLSAINIATSGEDPSYITLLPSGFTISPDGHSSQGGGALGASTSSNESRSMHKSGGSLITLAFQILISTLSSTNLNLELVATVNNLISTNVEQIKAALTCSSTI